MSLECRYLLLLLCLPLAVLAGEVHHHRDPETGLLSWKVKDHGFSLELIQLLPDYVRATYESRGFPPEVIDGIARYCVFGTIARNESDAIISYRVADWRYVTSDGQEHRLKTKTEWVKEWHDLGVAFHWTILPDDQIFEVGDWSQGFTTIALPPDSVFDLFYSWKQRDEIRTGKIEALRCAPVKPPES